MYFAQSETAIFCRSLVTIILCILIYVRSTYIKIRDDIDIVNAVRNITVL